MILDQIKHDASYELARRMDQEDPLRGFRDRFVIPDDTAYLCGNCLGLQPKTTSAYIQEVLSGWAEKGFRAHFTEPQNWLSYQDDFLTAPMAELVGALHTEVALMNSLSVNLHLMLISFFRPTRERHKILMEEGAFPSDRFVVHSQLRLHGHTPEDAIIEIGRSGATGLLDSEAIDSLIEERGHEIALILLGNPSFKNGQALDMEAITRAGRRKGCIVGFDLAHAAGNIE